MAEKTFHYPIMNYAFHRSWTTILFLWCCRLLSHALSDNKPIDISPEPFIPHTYLWKCLDISTVLLPFGHRKTKKKHFFMCSMMHCSSYFNSIGLAMHFIITVISLLHSFLQPFHCSSIFYHFASLNIHFVSKLKIAFRFLRTFFLLSFLLWLVRSLFVNSFSRF